MRYNDLPLDFKYLIVNEKDRSFGLTVNTVGFQPVAPNTVYPSTQHPKAIILTYVKDEFFQSIRYFTSAKGMALLCRKPPRKRI